MIALGCAVYGQQLLVANHDTIPQVIVPSIRWYALGIVLALVAWWGNYKNKRCVRVPEVGTRDQGSGIRDQGSEIKDRSPIPDP